jgi:drug/metabolite transporter (DMT)-like permease
MVALYTWNAMPSDASPPSLVQRNASPSLPSVGAMLLLAIMWGLSIPMTKLGLVTMPPLTLTALRFAVAVPLLFLFVVGRQRLPWRAFPRIAALGVLGIGVGQVTQTLGVVGTSASVGTIISATIPVFVVVFAARA